ncbi:AraC family transcriptional regulator [Actinacidiphila sp. ITFR-21]|uniref:AraC family transcriptional regulator n=1 Tax=Actinacidiphila sp. ITFR-21 TaxID=3075199 RepID=UPI0028895AB4|nr:AraC family transcriptional regulator ligand-binding domain-containing protein [Streptomyces sp. ITFR-21]WNI19054.1 AraC family transcriptional regulator ligand-binding domain-containing protein [Streptomyces sp. ITFR-21]
MPPADPTAALPTPALPAPVPGPAGAADAFAPAAALTESVALPRFIATAASRGTREAEALARAAGVPAVLRGPEAARVPSSSTYRLWDAVLARTGRPDVGLLAATRYRPGRLDLFDYLFSTAPTVGAGLADVIGGIHVLSTNSVMTVEESADELTADYGVRDGDRRLRGVVAEFSFAVFTSLLRHATASALSPSRITFTHKPPHGLHRYADAFGSARIEFGAATDSLTLHRRDLAVPLVTADASLAAIIRRNAAALRPPSRPAARTLLAAEAAVPGLRDVIAAQLPGGRPSLATAAGRLAISQRTLQRRLGEVGTTWRAEVDAVRREQSAGLRREGGGPAQLASRLGFAEPRSLRRAMRRWDAEGHPGADPGIG